LIVKPREFPVHARKLQALLRRISQDHPQYTFIKDALGRSLAGYKGELQVDYQLSHIPDEDYHIFLDLRLLGRQSFFQIDSLLLSKKLIISLEIKNMSGTLLFDQNFHQLIRVKDGGEEAFADPLSQIYRHKKELEYWLGKNRLPSLPITSLVVISSPYSIIKSTGSTKSIIPKEYLLQKISQIEYSNQKEILSEKELRKISRHFIKQHTPNLDPILKRFDMQPTELYKGVHCSNCNYLPMQKTYGSWFCPSCQTYSKTAHLQSLEDYFFLFGQSLTNAEAKAFFRIEKAYTVTRILQNLNLPYDKKHRTYQLTYPLKN